MDTDTTSPALQGPNRDDLLADCLDALAVSPEFAAELREILDGRERLGQLAPPTAPVGEGPAAAVPLTGTFGKYELCGVLGRGGMGVVYRARETETGRTFALKVIREGHLASPDHLLRFRADHQIAARLDHANIVPICEVGEHAGQPYFTMPLVEGGSLALRIKEAPLPSREAARLLAKVARAVHHAHEQGIIHRDLKPANILIDLAGEPHVIDFGLAKLLGGANLQTVTGQVLGTPGYMAPEQAAGRSGEPTPAIDVYGLGAVLYALLTGRPPFQAETQVETLRQVIDSPPAPPLWLNPKIDPDLQTICLKCLSKRPADRFASARELAQDVERYLDRKPIQARLPTVWRYVYDALRYTGISASDRRAWGNILLAGAGNILALHLCLFAFCRFGAPLSVLWSANALWWVPMFAILLFFLRRKGRQLKPMDRIPLVMWAGYALASLMLLPLVRPLEELGSPSGLLAWYPPLTVLTGVLFLIDASLHWGRSYLVGLGFMALAVPLWLLPDWAPLVFGLFAASCLTYLGLAYHRSARQAAHGSSPQQSG